MIRGGLMAGTLMILGDLSVLPSTEFSFMKKFEADVYCGPHHSIYATTQACEFSHFHFACTNM